MRGGTAAQPSRNGRITLLGRNSGEQVGKRPVPGRRRRAAQLCGCHPGRLEDGGPQVVGERQLAPLGDEVTEEVVADVRVDPSLTRTGERRPRIERQSGGVREDVPDGGEVAAILRSEV